MFNNVYVTDLYAIETRRVAAIVATITLIETRVDAADDVPRSPQDVAE